MNSEPRNMTPEERQARTDLAAAYRLIALMGWDDLIFTHVSLRLPGSHEQFLINPYGLFFDEITASSLVVVDIRGESTDGFSHRVNPAGFNIHGAIHAAREDAVCVMHTHSANGVAVSTQAEGLLPISQHSLVPISSLAYHDYEGVVLETDERPRLVRNLGSRKSMILRSHGLLTLGNSVADAFFHMYYLETACRIQLSAQASRSPLIQVAQPIVDGIARQLAQITDGKGGALVWPGLLRKLDRIDPSFRD